MRNAAFRFVIGLCGKCMQCSEYKHATVTHAVV